MFTKQLSSEKIVPFKVRVTAISGEVIEENINIYQAGIVIQGSNQFSLKNCSTNPIVPINITTCPKYCQQCKIMTNICEQCFPGFILENNICRRPICPSNCIICSKDNSCDSCNPEYFLDSQNQCVKCSKSCLKCFASTENSCYDCQKGYLLHESFLTNGSYQGICKKYDNLSELLENTNKMNSSVFSTNKTLTREIASILEESLNTSKYALNATNQINNSFIKEFTNFFDSYNDFIDKNKNNGTAKVISLINTSEIIQVLCRSGQSLNSNISKYQKNCSQILNEIKAVDFTEKTQVKTLFPLIASAAKNASNKNDIKADLLSSYKEYKKALWSLTFNNTILIGDDENNEQFGEDMKMKLVKLKNQSNSTNSINSTNFSISSQISTSVSIKIDLQLKENNNSQFLMEMVELLPSVAKGILPIEISDSCLSTIIELNSLTNKLEPISISNAVNINAKINFSLPKKLPSGYIARCKYYDSEKSHG